jgi:RNA-directed DNA polymerase
MSMRQAMRQMPVQTGRAGNAHGEAARIPVSDEVCGPRHESGDTGPVLLEAALTRENLKHAFRRIRSNKGAAGVDGLDIDQTARHLVSVGGDNYLGRSLTIVLAGGEELQAA